MLPSDELVPSGSKGMTADMVDVLTLEGDRYSWKVMRSYEEDSWMSYMNSYLFPLSPVRSDLNRRLIRCLAFQRPRPITISPDSPKGLNMCF